MSRFALVSLLFVACATDPVADRNVDGLGVNQETTITFAAGWTQSASGPLVAGRTVRVRYDLSRLTACDAESNGSEVWGVTGYAQFDTGAPPTTLAVSQLSGGKVVAVDAELPLPAAASHIALWFVATNEWGCTAYDSSYGANYGFDLDRRGIGATLSFGADWSFTKSAAVHAGDDVVVHYDTDRLKQCYALQNEVIAWSVTLHWQVDGGAVHDVAAGRPDGANLVPADPVIAVPPGGDLAMWFDATSVYGCHAWDSDYGANYHVAIQ